METLPDDESADLELPETEGEKTPPGVATVARGSVSPPAEVAPTRRRCRIDRTVATESVSGEGEASTGKTARYVPRPAVPTPTRTEILMKQAEDISIRGDPCLSSRKPDKQWLVRNTLD